VQAWCHWTQKNKEVLERVQKRDVRMVLGLKGSDYDQKIQELGLTTLEERRHQSDMLQVYKIILPERQCEQ
jgi:hypothetical protein